MSPDKSLQDLFNAALERQDATERARLLDEACGADAALRERVEKLLRAQEEIGGFMAQPSRRPPGLDSNETMPLGIPLTEKPGDRIGRYKLLQQIGEGGCGVVYMAEQEEPVRRRVALKVIKLGMDTKQVIARFEAERQALALMDHPNIAKVLDAGATETGRPYFVMELVRGMKITDFCDENKLSTEERLKLFMQVCQAIQHAHQKGVIHRDIKPSNILVTANDGVAVPKVIDFGIAKATAGRLTDQTLFTAFEQFIGTPAYMSPEQAVLTSLDIDTRSDIYSLGVLLYELLTASPPFDQKELLAAGLDGMRRIIRETEPPRPSTRLSTMAADSLTTTARHRHTEPPKLLQLVRGDLDWIVMKCLEKDRARRYETANGLAADIQRHLNSEPVLARPPSRLYEFQKTVRRHKFGFAAAGAVIVALAIGLGISTWQFALKNRAYHRATKAEQEQTRLRLQAEANQKKAETEAAKSQQVAQLLKDLVIGVGPAVASDRNSVILREVLDQTLKRAGRDLKEQPEVEAELRSTIGQIYHALGDFQRAKEMHGEALRRRKAIFGETNLWVAVSLSDLGHALEALGKLEEAETTVREALAMQRKLSNNTSLDTATTLHYLGDILERQKKMSEAEAAYREALEANRKMFGTDNVHIVTLLSDLGDALRAQGRNAEAASLYREELAARRRIYGETNRAVEIALANLARSLQGEGKLSEAEAAWREELAVERRLSGDQHPLVANSLHSLARVLIDAHRPVEAELLVREALQIQRKCQEKGHPFIRNSLVWLAYALQAQGKHGEALTILQEELDQARAADRNGWTSTNSGLGVLLHHFAEALWNQKAFKEARPPAEEAWTLFEQHPDWPEQERSHAYQVLHAVLTDLNDLHALESIQHKELESLRRKLPADDPQLANALADLARSLLTQMKFAEAEALARECLTIREKAVPEDWRTFNSRSHLGGSLLGQKKYAEAEPFLVSGYEGLKQRERTIPAVAKIRLKEAIERLAQLYQATGQPEKAAEWNKKLAEFDQAKAEK